MTVTRSNDGDWTSSATETDLATVTTQGVYELHFDGNAMANGDIIEVVYYGKTRAGGTERKMWSARFGWNYFQAYPEVICPARMVVDHLRVSIRQPSGSVGKTVPWAIYKNA